MAASISLLSDKVRISAPFIRVVIGGYSFGVYKEKSNGEKDYPNYIQSLVIKKINGTVNTYTLVIEYAVTENNDPNFFERVLSSVSDSRKIEFTYGDFSIPEYVYKDEEALITSVSSDVNIKNNSLSYTIKATSSSLLQVAGCRQFIKETNKPSDIIKRMLKNNSEYGLLDIFTGMRNADYSRLIASDDQRVTVEAKQNTSVLDYLYYLASCMTPTSSTKKSTPTVYALTTVDDTTGEYGGPYFTVKKVQTSSSTLNTLAMYTIDVGYPTANLVTDFRIENDQSYSILYDYNGSLQEQYYGKRIDDNGIVTYVYAPPLTSSSQLHLTTQSDIAWWSKVTSFPIKVSLTITGLLRPAVLMSYVKLNVWFFGRKHISSGYYIITSQTDSIGIGYGFVTQLSLTRVAPDEDTDAAIGLFGEATTKGIDATPITNSSGTFNATSGSHSSSGSFGGGHSSGGGTSHGGGSRGAGAGRWGDTNFTSNTPDNNTLNVDAQTGASVSISDTKKNGNTIKVTRTMRTGIK